MLSIFLFFSTFCAIALMTFGMSHENGTGLGVETEMTSRIRSFKREVQQKSRLNAVDDALCWESKCGYQTLKNDGSEEEWKRVCCCGLEKCDGLFNMLTKHYGCCGGKPTVTSGEKTETKAPGKVNSRTTKKRKSSKWVGDDDSDEDYMSNSAIDNDGYSLSECFWLVTIFFATVLAV